MLTLTRVSSYVTDRKKRAGMDINIVIDEVQDLSDQ